MNLFEGDSKKTLAIAELPKMDLIFIDGGHSIETISSDWKNIQQLIKKETAIFFDDYFQNLPFVGCSFLKEKIDSKKFETKIYDEKDIYQKKWGVLNTHLMKVSPVKINQISSQVSSNKFRFHLLGLSHLPVSEKYMGCAFTQKIVKLSKMLLSLGYKVFLYGAEGSDAPCTEFIQTHTLKDIRHTWGEGDNRFKLGYDWKNKGFKHDFNRPRTPVTLKYYQNCIDEINKRKKPDDFFLLSQGVYQKPISDKVNLYLTCEPGVGYRGSFTHFRAFESSYLQNFTYGSQHPGQCINGNYYDRVIPNYFDPDDFEFQEKKDDYFLYIGRLIQRKGILTAYLVAKELGVKLKIAGQGMKFWDDHKLVGEDFEIEGDNLEFTGFVSIEERKKLFAGAKTTFVPTIYLEAFGGVSIESLFSGTPVITTNFGVFPETIPSNVGYRCNTLNDFVQAAKNIDKIKPQDCRDYAMQNFSLDQVKWQFERWFQDLYMLWESSVDSQKRGWHRIYSEDESIV